MPNIDFDSLVRARYMYRSWLLISCVARRGWGRSCMNQLISIANKPSGLFFMPRYIILYHECLIANV